MTNRFPDIPGSINFRDLGGYAADKGQTVQWGRLFRSGHFMDVQAAGWQQLTALGAGHVIDLREQHERDAIPTPWPAVSAPQLLHAPRNDGAGFDNGLLMQWSDDLEAARAQRIEAYRHKPAQFAGALRLLFSALNAEPARPLVFHCMGGKDRTGFVAALILDWLGVSRKDIVADYMLTAQRISQLNPASLIKIMKLYKLDTSGAAALQAMTEVQPQYIEAALAVIDEDYGGSKAYLLNAGVTPQMLQRCRQTLLLRPDP